MEEFANHQSQKIRQTMRALKIVSATIKLIMSWIEETYDPTQQGISYNLVTYSLLVSKFLEYVYMQKILSAYKNKTKQQNRTKPSIKKELQTINEVYVVVVCHVPPGLKISNFNYAP